MFGIGTLEPSGPKTFTNPLKMAYQYKAMLDSGYAQSQVDLARILGVSRAKVTQMLNLLKLDDGIQEFILNLEETDARLKVLTERKLRCLVKMANREEQKERFWELADQ